MKDSRAGKGSRSETRGAAPDIPAPIPFPVANSITSVTNCL